MTVASETVVGQAFLTAAADRADACYCRIKHCVEQLTDEQLWWRPQASLNSIGNLLLHLYGNLTQWIIAGVTRAPDTRNRPQEFQERGPIPGPELIRRLEGIIAQVKHVLVECPPAALLEPRRIQGMDETVLSAILNSLTHLAGHTQEIVFVTRLQLGERDRFAWAPRTVEEGAAGATAHPR